jgi:hypothetical protein
MRCVSIPGTLIFALIVIVKIVCAAVDGPSEVFYPKNFIRLPKADSLKKGSAKLD